MPLGLEALTALPQVALGAYEAYQGQAGLKNLQGQPMPQYSMSPEFQDYYNTTKQRSQYGFDPQETAAFKQNVAQQQNTGYQQAIQQSGGNLAQALSVGLGAQKLGAFNQFAGQDAAQKRANISEWGGAAGQIQNQQNLINQQKIQHRSQLEQAYGGALRAGLGNVTSGLMSGLGLGFMGNSGNKNSYNPYGSMSDSQYGNMVDQDISSGYFNQK